MEHEPIVVTGAGCISALGQSVAAFWSALQDGRCDLGKLDQAAPSYLNVSIVGAVPAPDPRHMLDARQLPMLDRFSVLAIVAPQEACSHSRDYRASTQDTEPAASTASARQGECAFFEARGVTDVANVEIVGIEDAEVVVVDAD